MKVNTWQKKLTEGIYEMSSSQTEGVSMTHLNLTDSAEPCFITDGPPSNDLPQILAGITDDELARWPGDLADAEREKRRKAGG